MQVFSYSGFIGDCRVFWNFFGTYNPFVGTDAAFPELKEANAFEKGGAERFMIFIVMNDEKRRVNLYLKLLKSIRLMLCESSLF